MRFGVSIETVAPLLRQQTKRLRLLRRISAGAVAILTALWIVAYIVVEVRWRNGQMADSLIYGIEHVMILAVLLSLVVGLVAHSHLRTGDGAARGVRRERFLILQQIIAICVTGIIVAGALVAFGTGWNRGVLYPDWQQPAAVVPVRDSHSHIARGLDCKVDGDCRGAVREFRAAVEVSPMDPDAHWQLGLVYAEMGDGPAAIDQFGHVTAIAPETELGRQAAAEIKRILKLLEPQS